MKDPYLKPVIFGGLLITMLSVIFAPAIFLWAIIGGYVAVRIANKITKESISLIDSLFLGFFSGIIGGTSLDILTLLSFKSPDNQRLLIRTLEKNWPKEISSMPNFPEILPALFLTTSVFIIFITVLFAVIGSYGGVLISRRKKSRDMP